MRSLPLLLRAWRDPGGLVDYSLADWNLLLRQAESANLLASLGAMLEDLGLMDQVPAPARRHFDWWKVVAARHRQAVRYEVLMIAGALARSDVPLILLKGAAYAMADLPAGRGRLFSDIDILVPKARLGQVEAALMLAGWVGTNTDPYDQRYYRSWMHELPPMQHLARGTLIDVHHTILPETAAVRPDPAKLRGAARPLGTDKPLATLAPADMVLHSATHLFYGEFEHGLRDLVDIERLLRHFAAEPLFWEGLVARARELELGRPLFYALRWAVRLLGAAVPAHVIDNSRLDAPNPLLLALMDWLFSRAMLPAHPSIDRAGTAPARLMLYIRANWLRMPPLLLARHLFHKAFISPKSA